MRINYVGVRYLTMLVFTIAIGMAVYAIASAPSRQASRLGMRGLKRRRALEDNDVWKQIEPLVRWLGMRVSGVLSESFRTKVERQLVLGGDWLGITPDEFVALSIVSFFGGLGFGSIAGQMTGMGAGMIFVVGPIFAFLPWMQLSGVVSERMKSINRGLPYAIDLVALAMSAGKDFPGAIRQVVEKSSDPDDALVEEFGRILQELNLGRTRKQALVSFAGRAPLETVQEFVNSVVQAEEKGNPLADVLQIQAGMTRMRRSVKAEQMAAQAGVKMIGPLALLMLCIMALILGPMFLKLGKETADT
jgi:tight adherence protein C